LSALLDSKSEDKPARWYKYLNLLLKRHGNIFSMVTSPLYVGGGVGTVFHLKDAAMRYC